MRRFQIKKAADMISRLCSNVESFRGADSYPLAEKLFLVRFDNRAATGIRGVLSPRALGQFGGVRHFGYGPLQLEVQVGQPLIRLVGAVSRLQDIVADPRADPGDVIFDHGRRNSLIGIVFIILRGEFAERVQDAVSDCKLVRRQPMVVVDAVDLELRVSRDLPVDQSADEHEYAGVYPALRRFEELRREETQRIDLDVGLDAAAPVNGAPEVSLLLVGSIPRRRHVAFYASA